jgi:ABC-type glycerol-3-phosphate transport system permease component
MDRCVNAGISGALLSLFINVFSPVYLYFIPSFVAAVVFIYVSRLRTTREGLVTSLMTFVLGDGIFNTLNNAIYYLTTSEPYVFSVDIVVVVSPILSAFFAVLAGYIGARLVGRVRPTQEMPQPPMPPQPIPPV